MPLSESESRRRWDNVGRRLCLVEQGWVVFIMGALGVVGCVRAHIVGGQCSGATQEARADGVTTRPVSAVRGGRKGSNRLAGQYSGAPSW